MLPYIIRRLIIMVPLVLGITFMTFMILQLAPGDYFTQLELDQNISRETLARMRAEFGLDRHPVIQYLLWLKGLLHFNLGYSIHYKVPVSTLIGSRLFNTFILSLSGLLFSWILAIPLGVYSAVHQYSTGDKITSFGAFVGMSIPNFFFAFLLLYLAALTGILPVGGMVDPEHAYFSSFGKLIDYLRHLIIPTIVLGTGSLAGLLRLMRGNLLENLQAQYITTARSKGLSERRVIYIHALRNAINPMITIFGYELSGLLSGAALTEIITAWPGLGKLMLDATLSQDIYLIIGSLLMGSVLLIIGNLIADILLAVSDPRIRLS